MKSWRVILIAFAVLLSFGAVASAQVNPAVQDSVEKIRQQALLPLRVSVGDDQGGGGRDLTAAIEIVLFLSLLTLLPSLVLTVTCFTRVVIVLSFVRRAMATPEMPPNAVLIGLALFLSAAVMQPVASAVYDKAVQPYLAEELTIAEAGDAASRELKTFLLRYTREEDVALFMEMVDDAPIRTPEDLPLRIAVPAYVVSELKTAFIMGFVIYLPFLVVDLVISSILLSMGMIMLPPMIIATPIKLLLFILMDGWNLVISQVWTSLVT